MSSSITVPLQAVTDCLRAALGDKGTHGGSGWKTLTRKLRDEGLLPPGKMGPHGHPPKLDAAHALHMFAAMLTDEPAAKAAETIEWLSELKPYAMPLQMLDEEGQQVINHATPGDILGEDAPTDLLINSFMQTLAYVFGQRYGVVPIVDEYAAILNKIEVIASPGNRIANLQFAGLPPYEPGTGFSIMYSLDGEPPGAHVSSDQVGSLRQNITQVEGAALDALRILYVSHDKPDLTPAPDIHPQALEA